MAKASSSVALLSVPENRMSKSQAIVFAKKMTREGKTYDQISKELAKKGYTGPRTGKPLANSSLSAMITGSAAAKKSKRVFRNDNRRSQSNLTTTIHTVLSFKNVSSDEKIALLELFLEANG